MEKRESIKIYKVNEALAIVYFNQALVRITEEELEDLTISALRNTMGQVLIDYAKSEYGILTVYRNPTKELGKEFSVPFDKVLGDIRKHLQEELITS